MPSEVIREFLSALLCPKTYDIRRNQYIIFGLLWGLPVPLLGLFIEIRGGMAPAPAALLKIMVSDPFHLFLLLHPFFFAVLFGTLGTIRLRKMAHIEDLLGQLAQEVELLSQANAELQELDRLKDEFLSNVTHELKTPLVTIRGYAEMLAGSRLGELTDRQQRAVGVMLRNASRLQEQIDRILAGSRNLHSMQDIDPQTLSLTELVLEVMSTQTPAAESRGVDISLKPPKESIRLHADRVRILEVFNNLVSNAIKFTEPGGRVWISFGEPADGRLPVEVGDTGCGIAPSAQAHIFERFRQADGSIRRAHGGSGLGLSIVQQNLEAHGGTIEVHSAEGKGTRFIFDLPLATQPAGERDEGASGNRGVTAAGSAPRVR